MRWSEDEYVAWVRAGGHAWVPREIRPAAPSEEAFLQQVRGLAKQYGWLSYHTRDSRRSDEGFPDVVLVKPGRVLFVELKNAKGKLTQAQATWLDVLAHSVPGVEVYLWRPADWETIVQILTTLWRDAP